jgi:signal transduction histidine kinase
VNVKRESTALLVGAVGVLVAATLVGQHDRLFGFDVAVGAASLGVSVLLPRRPVLATLLLDVLAALSPAGTPAATTGTLWVAHRRPFRTACAVAGAGIVAHAVRGAWRPIGGLPYAWWLVLVVVAHAGLLGWGSFSRARIALIASLRERAERAEAEQGRRVAEARVLERTRIAREMHDVLAHRLSLIATYAGALEYRPDSPPEQLAKAAGVIRTGVRQALDELRDVLAVLRDDDEPDDEPDDSGPQPVYADLPRLLDEARDAGTPVELSDRTTRPGQLPITLSRTVYRVVQEGLTNARKHAPGSPVGLVLTGAPGDRLEIDLRNPTPRGLPGNGETSIPGAGVGLVGVAERVRLAGGGIEHGVSGAEFRLRVWLPFPACTQ